MLLTRHARKRLVKRLARKNRLEVIYSRLWAFLDGSILIDVNEKVVIFTDGRKSLVGVRLPCERLSLEEIRKRVKTLKGTYTCVFWDSRVVRETTPVKFVSNLPEGTYCFYASREKRSLYIGSDEPILVLTIRPAKRRERSYLSPPP
jgi:hypothetical protein